MTLTPLPEIKRILERELSRARFEHSLAVARLAKRLAGSHDVDPATAERAGLVHDCAKEWSPKEFLKYVNKKRIKIPDLDFIKEFNPNMMHAYVGSVWAYERGWISHVEQKAIASHTLADYEMSTLDKIIYISDFAAYDRKYKQAKMIRKEAVSYLHRAYLQSIRYKMASSLKKQKPVHPFALSVWNHAIHNH